MYVLIYQTQGNCAYCQKNILTCVPTWTSIPDVALPFQNRSTYEQAWFYPRPNNNCKSQQLSPFRPSQTCGFNKTNELSCPQRGPSSGKEAARSMVCPAHSFPKYTQTAGLPSPLTCLIYCCSHKAWRSCHAQPFLTSMTTSCTSQRRLVGGFRHESSHAFGGCVVALRHQILLVHLHTL